MGSFFYKPEPEPSTLPEELFVFFLMIAFYFLIIKSNNKKNKKDKNKNTKKNELDNIIGLESVKEEMKYYMDFIKNKEKYKEWGVKLPKGILLSGPPGTGKTLLVKTLSKNLDIPLICACGSEFIEKYVGVGAARVRKLFKKAKKEKECIIFIDEIDAVGTKRDETHNSERATTVNQLLTEMDGFNETNNIIIFAATNLVKLLDPALTRSGRFDKKVYFDLPNKSERINMYKLYLKGMILPRRLSFNMLAERTAGISGADIANIANQSKINAIQNGNSKNTLTEDNIQTAIDEVIIGREKRERILSKEELIRVSHHEAGHCLMGYLLKYTEQPVKVSIIPRGEAALGFSQQKATNKKIMVKEEILCRIAVLLGGRSAEKIMYNNVSTGASDDIEKISRLIKQYTIDWGMNEKTGPLNIEVMKNIGRNLSTDILDSCKDIVNNIEIQTMELLTQHKRHLIKIANSLLKNETINYKEIKSLVPKKLENSAEIII